MKCRRSWRYQPGEFTSASHGHYSYGVTNDEVAIVGGGLVEDHFVGSDRKTSGGNGPQPSRIRRCDAAERGWAVALAAEWFAVLADDSREGLDVAGGRRDALDIAHGVEYGNGVAARCSPPKSSSKNVVERT